MVCSLVSVPCSGIFRMSSQSLSRGEAHHIEDPATQGQVANWGKEVSEPEQGMPHEVNFLYLTVF